MEDTIANKDVSDSIDIEQGEDIQFEHLPDDSSQMQSDSNLPDDAAAGTDGRKKIVTGDDNRDSSGSKDRDASSMTEENDLSKTRNTISADIRASNSKRAGTDGSENNDNVVSDEAMRELAELFNSGEEAAKDYITPEKGGNEKQNKVDKDEKPKEAKTKGRKKKSFDSEPPSTGKGKIDEKKSSDEVKIPKKRGRKKMVQNENKTQISMVKQTPQRNELFEVNMENKFVIKNDKLSASQLKERYQDMIFEYRSEDEVYCLVCLDGESFEEDDIIICDLCSCAFHQSCYGSELLNIAADDESEWYCRRCSHLFNNNLPVEAVKCIFCPELKGPMKKVRESGTNEWAHIACVNWIPEIYYQDDQEKVNVVIAEYKSRNHCGRSSLLCSFCKIKYGDSIQCDTQKCIAAFHVTCAQKHGLVCNWKEMEGLKRDEDTEFYIPIYCKRHMKAYDEKIFQFSNKVEEKNEARSKFISCLYDPLTPSKVYSTPRKGRKSASMVSDKSASGKRSIENKITPFEETKTSSVKKHSLVKHSDAQEAIHDRLSGRRLGRNNDDDDEVAYQVVETDELANLKPQKSKIIRDSSSDEEERKNPRDEEFNEFLDSTFVRVPDSISKKNPYTSPPKLQKLSAKDEDYRIDEEENNKPEAKQRQRKKREEKLEKLEKKKVEDKTKKSGESNQEKKEKKASSGVLYKFRPNMAKLIMFNGWATENEVKKVIQDYIKAKNLYRKDREELDISRDPKLEEIMGLRRIPRKSIFSEFMHFLLKKSPEEVLKEDESPSLSSTYMEEYRKHQEKVNLEKAKMKHAEDDYNTRIKRKNPPPTTNIKKPLPKNTQADAPKETGLDFFNWKPKHTEVHHDAQKPKTSENTDDHPIVKKVKPNTSNIPNPPPTSTSQPKAGTSSIMQTFFGEGDAATLGKTSAKRREIFEGLAPIIKGADKMPFRKTMNWFVKTEASLAITSINANSTVERLWPKGAEILF